ncbi:unnamed protein product [Adineta steineri]|uniref:Uncharacterized protein n=1 Tax=Adineta steineri TaxID=433720 RepID=A0A815UQR6_9BILA|nr:unnamed protein product [Adineta steineri]CAF1524093.1 unnamed protein product [Adineta steineri]
MCVPLVLGTTSNIASTTYSGSLSFNSPGFVRPDKSSGDYYYQAIRVTVSTSGTYIFTSTSSKDTYGCFYSDSFDPSYPSQNLITTDDDGASNSQFRISTTLQSSRTYILIVTTYDTNTIGSFVITVNGPASVALSAFILSTALASSPASTISSYSGYLLSSSQSFARPDYSSTSYYYEAIQVTVRTSGRYSFTSISSYDTYGYLYNDPFNPSKPSRNLIASDDDSGNSHQFRINATLQSGSTYVLVFTTLSTWQTGSFRIAATGPAPVTLSSYTPSSADTGASEWATWKTVCIVVPCVILFAGLLSVCVYRQKRKAISNRDIRSAPRNQTMHPQMYPMTNINGNISQPPYTISSPSMYPSHMEEEPPSYESLPPYFKAQYPPYST